MGASRTLGTHVRHWERLRDWARSKGLNVNSMDVSVVVKHLLDLDERGCGPTVITSVRMAVKWIGKRLYLTVPDMTRWLSKRSRRK